MEIIAFLTDLFASFAEAFGIFIHSLTAIFAALGV